MTRKQFLDLPRRKWDATSTYDSIYIVPTYDTHKDSGYRLMAVVGALKKKGPVEIAAIGDVIDWERTYDSAHAIVKNEMDPSTNILHVWSHTCKFKVGHCPAQWTVEITIV